MTQQEWLYLSGPQLGVVGKPLAGLAVRRRRRRRLALRGADVRRQLRPWPAPRRHLCLCIGTLWVSDLWLGHCIRVSTLGQHGLGL